MPIYLVRWPGWFASLVRARDEFELEMILDQEASTEGVTWEEYDGPLAIDFELNAEFDVSDREGRDSELRVGGIRDLAERPFRVRPGGSEEAAEMVMNVLWSAFPALAPVLQKAAEDDQGPSAAEVHEALRAELAEYLKARATRPEPIPEPVEAARRERAKWRPGKVIPLRPRPPRR